MAEDAHSVKVSVFASLRHEFGMVFRSAAPETRHSLVRLRTSGSSPGRRLNHGLVGLLGQRPQGAKVWKPLVPFPPPNPSAVS